jgi:putative aldouronate transport system permease protein
MMTAQLIWKETGWGTVIYLAALLNIDAQLYEAAAVDGANWLRRMWHITLPGLMFIVSLFLILRVGLLTATGGEQILLQRQNVGATAGEVLYTYVYFHGLVGGQWSVAAAAGLLNGVIGLVLILASYRVARRFGFNIAPGPRAA